MAITHAKGRFRICTTPQTPTLDLAAFEALSYVDVTGIVTAPSFSVQQNTLSEQTLDTEIDSISGGVISGEETEIVLSFKEGTDSGVAAMEAAAASSAYFAVQYELNNSGGTNGTTYFALVFVGGGGGPSGGGVEDFAQRRYTMRPTDQRPIEKAAA